MKKIISTFSILYLLAIAIPVLAETPKNFKALIDMIISGILRPLVPFLVGLAVVVFIYGVITLMLSEGGEKKEEGKQFMLWGIIGIFVMVSVWGLVAILSGTFQLDTKSRQIEIEKPIIIQNG